MAAENGVILSVDTSGSVYNCHDYYNYIRNILDEIKPVLKDVPIISWNTESLSLSLADFMRDYVDQLNGDGGTSPQTMVSTIETVVKTHKLNIFELIITTDGEINQKDTEEYCELMKKSDFFDKITNVRVYFIGDPPTMNTNITHAFEKIPLTFAINEHIAEAKKDLELSKDERFTNFKIENVPSLVDDLAIQLSVMPNTRANKTAVRELLDKIKGKYLKALFDQDSESGNKESRKDPAEVIHELLNEWKLDELKKYYCELFTKQKDDMNDKKINRLYNMLHQDSVQCHDLMFFIPSAMNTEVVKNLLDECDVNDEGNANDEYIDREKFCAIYYIESSLPVLQLQKLPLAEILEVEYDTLYNDRKKLARCPLQIFEFINTDNFNDAILADHISAEAFVDFYKVEHQYNSQFTFKSTCNTEAYGIMLYNYPNSSDIDHYTDKNSELYKEKTAIDDNIVNHICCIISDYLFESRQLLGNRGLWAISLLYSIYNTKRVQSNEFLKRCIRYTIIRISLVFKCNLPVFKGIHPQVNVPIHDALLCALHVASTVFQTENNFTRKLDESGPIYVQMMKTIFNQKIPEQICFDDWFSWKYMFKLSKDVKKRRILEPIVQTKIQDWINTENGPLILEGKTNDDVYDEAIKNSKIENVYKMVKILKDHKIETTKNFNYAKIKVDIPDNIAETKIISRCTIDHQKHVKICQTTCRPTFICNITGKPWQLCVPENLRTKQVSFYNLYGKYCHRYKKFPSADEMLSYLVKLYPGRVYYKNTKEVITEIIQQFSELDLDVETFIKRFRNSMFEDKRILLESSCKCPAHSNSNSNYNVKLVSIYVLICAILMYIFLYFINK